MNANLFLNRIHPRLVSGLTSTMGEEFEHNIDHCFVQKTDSDQIGDLRFVDPGDFDRKSNGVDCMMII